jgi:hypothetical protein
MKLGELFLSELDVSHPQTHGRTRDLEVALDLSERPTEAAQSASFGTLSRFHFKQQ